MNNILLIIIGIIVSINIVSFLMMMIDKSQARKGKDRISEGSLFFWAIMFGGVGVYLGMFAFRHKTQKWYFYIGIPLLVMQNFALLYLMYKLLNTTI